jgi:ankyrin repeat protein
MKKRILFAGIAAVCLSAAPAAAMLQSDFVNLCREGSPSEVALALQTGKVSAASAVQGVTPLMAAASSRGDAASTEKIRQLIRAGAEVNAADRAGMTALMYAARFSDKPGVIRALIDAGADVNARDRHGWTPLSHAAAKNYKPEIVMELVDAGSDVNVRDHQNVTPLMLAFRGGVSKATVTALLDSGADPALKDRKGRTAADYFRHSPLKNDADVAQALKAPPAIHPVDPPRFAAVCRFGTLQRLQSLIAAGTDPTTTVDGLTPLMWAALDNADPAVLKALLDAGADMDASDPEGRTALMYAAQNSAAAMKVLLDAGARFDSVDKNGRTALDYAQENTRIAQTDLLPLKRALETVNRVRAEGGKQLEAEKKARAAEAAKSAEELKNAQNEATDLRAQLEAEKEARAAEAAKSAGALKAAQDKAEELEKKLTAAETKKEN